MPSPGLGARFDDLAESFNAMAQRLDEGERLRRRLLADVAHEVRTPVATVAAYLEALEDGVRQLDPETVAVLRDRASRLTRLSDDLAVFPRAESGDLPLELAPASPSELAAAAVAAHQERAAPGRSSSAQG